MKQLLFVRNSVIVVLCVTILFLSVGFIVLSMELKSKSDEVSSFDVSFVDVRKTSSVKGSSIEPVGSSNIIESGKELDMHFTLNSFHDEITYQAIIRNNGTLSAEIVDLIEIPNYEDASFSSIISPVTITLSNIKGKILPPGEELEVKIIVYYSPSKGEAVKKSFPYRLALVTKSR